MELGSRRGFGGTKEQPADTCMDVRRSWAQAFHSNTWWEEGRRCVGLDARRNLGRQTDQNGISQQQDKLPREMIQSPLEIFKNQLCKAPSNLAWPHG